MAAPSASATGSRPGSLANSRPSAPERSAWAAPNRRRVRPRSSTTQRERNSVAGGRAAPGYPGEQWTEVVHGANRQLDSVGREPKRIVESMNALERLLERVRRHEGAGQFGCGSAATLRSNLLDQERPLEVVPSLGYEWGRGALVHQRGGAASASQTSVAPQPPRAGGASSNPATSGCCGEHLAHAPALPAGTSSVNQADLAEPLFVGGFEVRGDHVRHVPRPERVQVNRILDLEDGHWRIALLTRTSSEQAALDFVHARRVQGAFERPP